jgi:intraflagellar transport protein 52
MLSDASLIDAERGNGQQPVMPTILFDISKKEALSPSNGLKNLTRKLRNSAKIGLNKEDISLEKLGDASCLIFAAPCEKFTMAEV